MKPNEIIMAVVCIGCGFHIRKGNAQSRLLGVCGRCLQKEKEFSNTIIHKETQIKETVEDIVKKFVKDNDKPDDSKPLNLN